MLKNLRFATVGGTKQGRYGIVAHCANVSIENVNVNSMNKFGILIESNTGGGALEGSTTGVGVNADFWRLRDVTVNVCGDNTTAGATTGGGGIRVHGSDSNGGIAIACTATNCNLGFSDGSLGGATWISCYSQAAPVGFRSQPGTSSVFIGCFSEDTTALSITEVGYGAPNASHVTFGGTVDNADKLYGTRVAGPARMKFSGRNTFESGVSYDAQIPFGEWKAALVFARSTGATTTPQWTLGYDPNGYLGKMWAIYLRPETVAAGTPLNPYSAPFAFTDADHARGPGLPSLRHPILNSQWRWTWRQRGVVLAAGMNTPYTPFFTWGGSDGYIADEDVRVTVSVEMPTGRPNTTDVSNETSNSATITTRMSQLSSHPIKVGAVTVRWRDYAGSTGGGSFAAQVFNEGGSSVTVDLIWHFEIFQTNTVPDGTGWAPAP